MSGYLALAAATLGDREAARQHASAAPDTATKWGWTAYADWLGEARALGLLIRASERRTAATSGRVVSCWRELQSVWERNLGVPQVGQPSGPFDPAA